MKNNPKSQIQNRDASIAVIGLGYVGLPLAIELSKKYPTVGFDLNEERIKQLKEDIDKTLEVDETELNIKAKLDFHPMQAGDVKESFADIDYSKKHLNFNPKTNLSVGIPTFIKWYKNYYNNLNA